MQTEHADEPTPDEQAQPDVVVLIPAPGDPAPLALIAAPSQVQMAAMMDAFAGGNDMDRLGYGLLGDHTADPTPNHWVPVARVVIGPDGIEEDTSSFLALDGVTLGGF